MTKRYYGFEFVPANTIISAEIVDVGMENVMSDNLLTVSELRERAVRGTEWRLHGADAEMYNKLLSARAYVKMWIVGIEHLIPTMNRKLYGQAAFVDGLDRAGIKQQMSLGGVPGEGEHPSIIQYSDDPKSQMNLYNNMRRVCEIDPDNTTHFITAYVTTPERTYLEIKTNPKNPLIITDMIAGKKPAFSIRTKGDFAEPDENGYIHAIRIDVITADYVKNPANGSSIALPEMQFIDPINAQVATLTLQPSSLGLENTDFLNDIRDTLGEGAELIYDASKTGMEALSLMEVKTSKKDKLGFEKSFDLASCSFLD